MSTNPVKPPNRRNDSRWTRTLSKLLTRNEYPKPTEKSPDEGVTSPGKKHKALAIRNKKKDGLTKNDILIAVIGPAGSGKTTFIQTATGCNLSVGHGLQSGTREIAPIRVHLTDISDIVLIDTPGFDDTGYSALETHNLISDWLQKADTKGSQLAGIIYLQPILDKRLGGPLHKNLNILQNLCGRDGARRVVLATTMWQEVQSKVGDERENKLKRDWTELGREDSTFLRFDNTRTSAWHALDHIIALETDRHWIQTQADLAAFKKDFLGAETGERFGDPIERMIVTQQDIRRRMKEKLMEAADPVAREALMGELNTLRGEQQKIISDICTFNPASSDPLERLFYGVPEASSRLADTTSRFLRDRCRELIPKISENENQSAIVCGLKGDEAQYMVDFLTLVLHDADVLPPGEWRRVLALLCKLAKVAHVYPHCYELKGVQYDNNPIAEGGFANVHKGSHQNKSICVKIVKQANTRVLRMHIKELTLWAHLTHPNILPFYGVYVIGGDAKTCLVSPWMRNGSLRDYVNQFPEQPRTPWISDIACGMLYLHQLDIVHGDLKGMNILVSDDRRALIADFGLSCIEMATKTSASAGGSTHWMAPELFHCFEAPEVTKACDIWSFGCLCYEVLSRKLPFYQYDRDAQVIAALQRGELPRRPEPGDTDVDEIDGSVWSLIMDCWVHDPQQRPSWETIQGQIADHPESEYDSRMMSEGSRENTAFWKSVTTESKIEIDLERVYQTLRRESFRFCQ